MSNLDAQLQEARERNANRLNPAGPERLTQRRPSAIAKYGLTLQDFAQLSIKQKDRCAICGETQERELAIDHCHTSGKVRGLLCSTRNSGLGHFKDNPALLRKAIQYLRKSRAQ